jgi:AAA+ ATPase superfamily predicted ATPase
MGKKNLFIGRQGELKELKLLLSRKTAALVVIKGRRRIGKSRLIEEFAKGKNFLRFEGMAPTRRTTAQAQREEFARQIHQQLGIPGLHNLRDWGDLFTLVAESTKKEEIIILFDEITWMGSRDPVFLGKLKIVWDQYFQKNPNLILILCGSMSSWIEKNIIGSTGFLGRISLKLNLEEMSLYECNTLLKAHGFKGSVQEKFMLLAVTGGVPWYIEQINPLLPAHENIRKLCFEPNGLFVDEFKYIFHDLFGKRLPICKKIVESLKDGPKEYKEIAHHIQYPSGGPLSDYFEDLIISGFLEREHTWSLQSGQELKSSKYRIRDNYLRYYLKYILPSLRRIKKGLFKTMNPFNMPGWEGVMGLQFENLVLNNRASIWNALELCLEDIVFENPYFQPKTLKQAGCQIDYLIQTRFKNLYICEIKFSHKAISIDVVREMKEKLKAIKVPKGVACLPVLIHVNGVTRAVKESDFFSHILDFSNNLAEPLPI